VHFRHIMRWALLIAVSGCVTSPDDHPGLFVNAGPTNLGISLVRGPEHTFDDHLVATVNGIDCGPAMISPGMPATLESPDTPVKNAVASFAIPLSQVGADASVTVIDGSDTFAVDAPTVGLPRQLELLTSLSAPLHAGDWIDMSSGVETDQLLGGLTISVASQLCAGLGATRHDPGAIGVQVPTDLAQRWMCGAVPVAGTRVPATLELTLWASAPMTCIRPQIATCGARLPTLTVDAPVDVQF
jgi:hypothetical protein